MPTKLKYSKYSLLVICVMVFDITMASFSSTGSFFSENSNSKKYSLKNLSSFEKKAGALNSMRINMALKGSIMSASSLNSELSYESGNTTYNFKSTFKASKFKTPAPSN